MRSSLGRVSMSAIASVLLACAKDTTSPVADAKVSVQGQCDPASFNAALGSGAFAKQGTMTFAQFNSELNATHQVAAWRFVPNAFTIRMGQSITATMTAARSTPSRKSNASPDSRTDLSARERSTKRSMW